MNFLYFFSAYNKVCGTRALSRDNRWYVTIVTPLFEKELPSPFLRFLKIAIPPFGRGGSNSVPLFEALKISRNASKCSKTTISSIKLPDFKFDFSIRSPQMIKYISGRSFHRKTQIKMFPVICFDFFSREMKVLST